METPPSKARQNKILMGYVSNQPSFDALFELLYHHERTLVVRAAEAIERITKKHQEYLRIHKTDLLRLFATSDHPELRGYLIKLITRVTLEDDELDQIWKTLHYWARNPNESKPVRAQALQALYSFTQMFPQRLGQFQEIFNAVKREPIPSLQRVLSKMG